MFTINLSFNDALTCFEALANAKKDDELRPIEQEFVKYADKKANVGDTAAQAWLKAHGNNFKGSKNDSTDISPMSYFVGVKRPSEKDKELEDLENGILPKESNAFAPSKNTQDKLLGVIELEIEDKKREINRVRKKLQRGILNRAEIKKAMKRFDSLIGLGQVKSQITTILETKIIEDRRRKVGLKSTIGMSNHMAFMGNPGTGKTTVARLIAKVFDDLGILSKGHLTEVTRADLIGEYIGQTEQIIKEVIGKAKGGVLLIDEAYSLHKPHSPNDYGHDVINFLIKVLEDERNDLIVIFAGYENEMKFFLKSNPGLKSRIPHHIHFGNMEVDQLLEIFKTICAENDYTLSDESTQRVFSLLKDQKRQDISEFPNARGVRNLYEEVIRRQSQRLLDKNLSARKKLKEILPEDIPIAKPLQDGNVVQLPRN